MPRRHLIRMCILVLLSGLYGCRATSGSTSNDALIYVLGQNAQGGAELRGLDSLSLQATAPVRGAYAPIAAISGTMTDQLFLLAGSAAGFDASKGELISFHWNGKPQFTIPLHLSPAAIVLSADETTAYVAGKGVDGDGEVLAVNLRDHSTGARARVGGTPSALALNAAGDRLLIAAAGPPTLTVMKVGDANRLSATAAVRLDSAPVQAVTLPYGDKAFVLCPATNRVAVVDSRAGTLLTYLAVGPEPAAMVLKPDGGEIYVSNAGAGTVSAVNTTTNEVTDTMLAGRGPRAMAVSSDGSVLYVANRDAGTVSAISLSDRRTAAVIMVGGSPGALLLGPVGPYLFAMEPASDTLAVVRADQNSLLALLPSAPHATAITSVFIPPR